MCFAIFFMSNQTKSVNNNEREVKTMKKIIFASISLVLVIITAFAIFSNNNKTEEASYLRIHIRANSNSEKDQGVKYKVKAAVVDYLTPKIADGSTFSEVYEILNENLHEIEAVADEVLKQNGFSYTSKASLRDEYFPTRSYGEYTLEDGYYDALILELGTGEGNNWWCVVYPPLCFIGAEGNSTANIKYKSKLMEIINKFFK